MSDITKLCKELKMSWIRDNFEEELAEATRKKRTSQQLLERLLAGETEARSARAVERRFRAAHLPGMHKLEAFDWAWPTVINVDHIRHISTLQFMHSQTNVVLVGTVGLGKTHIASAIGRNACLKNKDVLFASAASIINTLCEAQEKGNFPATLRRYTRPHLLIVDELGYLPIDKIGGELLFQVFGQRYEKASTIITTNRVYKEWSKTFDNDSALTSAVLDRIVHHCETVKIEGESYRMKDRIEIKQQLEMTD
jgi:DNA replication protein DnaC